MLWTLLGTGFDSLSILWNWGKIPCCPASFHQGSSRSQWFKLAAGCFLFPAHASFRGHCFLYRGHHHVLLHLRMHICSDCSRLCLSHHPSSCQYFQSKCPFKTGSVMYGHLFQQGVKTKEHITACHHVLVTKKSQQDPAAWIQKAQATASLCVFSNKLLRQKLITHRVQLSCIFLWVITFCHVSRR